MKTVRQYDLDGYKVGSFLSAKEVEIRLGFKQKAIQRACREGSYYKGFIWTYAN